MLKHNYNFSVLEKREISKTICQDYYISDKIWSPTIRYCGSPDRSVSSNLPRGWTIQGLNSGKVKRSSLLKNVQAGARACPTSCSTSTMLLTRCVTFTTNHHLLPRLRMSTAVPPTLCMPPWHGQDNFISFSTTHYWKATQGILRELRQSQL